tara:strand:- start:2045 stop:3421 length:1377 start_codon:yes stop_codon:yes gene_type:complete
VNEPLTLWFKEILFLALIVAVGGAVGYVYESALLGVVSGAVLLLALHFAQVFALSRTLSHTATAGPKSHLVLSPIGRFLQKEIRNLFALHTDQAASIVRLKKRGRKRQRALSNAISDFRNFIEALPDAVVMLDREHRVVFWNQAATNLLGISSALDKKRPIEMLVNDSDFTEFMKNVSDEPFEVYSPTSSKHLLSIRVVSTNDQRYLLQAQDMTRVRQLEDVRRDFVANASHELRTPLTVVHGYLETLMDHYPQEESSELMRIFRQMHLQTDRIKRIVEDMLMLSRLDRDPEKSNEMIDVDEFLRAGYEEAVTLASEKKHEVLLDCDEGYSFMGSVEELSSLLTNLVSNAVRYTPEKGTITIGWSVSQEGAYLSVKDNGIGIEGQHISRLTERFYRVDVARSRELGGTGLGLAIVKHVLSRMDGELSISSRPGLGSTFVCRFPTSSVSHNGPANKQVS